MLKSWQQNKKLILWLLLFFILLSLTLNNTSPYKGDESYYLVSGLYMEKTGNLLLPRYFNIDRVQKPIITYWLVYLGYKIFGIHLWSGRVFFLFIAIFLLILLYKFALLFKKDQNFALFNVILLSSSTMFLSFSRIAMTDLLLTYFMTAALYYYIKAIQIRENMNRYIFLSSIFIGLSISTKGIIGLVPLFIMVIYLVFIKPENYTQYLKRQFHPINIFIILIIAIPWYTYIYIYHNDLLFQQMNTETSGRFSISIPLIIKKLIYYIVVLLRYYFPFSILVLFFIKKQKISLKSDFKFLLLYQIFIFFLFAVLMNMYRSRYLLIIFPSLTIILSLYLYNTKIKQIIMKTAAILFFIQSIVFIIIPYVKKEPMKEIANYWVKYGDGNFAAYNIDIRSLGWLEIFTKGKRSEHWKNQPYLIIKAEDYSKFNTYKIIKKSRKIKKIRIKNFKIVKIYDEFYLIKK